jgi:hypothetical protein
MLRELDSGNDGEPKQDSAATLNGTAAKAAGAPAGLGELGVCADAHLIDPDDIGHRTDVPRVFQRRVGQMRPDAYQAAVIGNYPCLLLADEPWPHYFRHTRIAPQLRIKTGVGDDNRPGGDLERGFRRLRSGVGEVDENAQPIAFLDNGRPKRSQSAKAWRVGVHITQWHGGVAVVKQAKLSQTSVIGFFHTLKVALKEVAAFDRLNDCRPALRTGAVRMSVGFKERFMPLRSNCISIDASPLRNRS